MGGVVWGEEERKGEGGGVKKKGGGGAPKIQVVVKKSGLFLKQTRMLQIDTSIDHGSIRNYTVTVVLREG